MRAWGLGEGEDLSVRSALPVALHLLAEIIVDMDRTPCFMHPISLRTSLMH